MKQPFLQKIHRWRAEVKARFTYERGRLNSDAEGFADYALKVHAGTTDQLIVAFSGVGNVATGEVHFEWSNSLINACEGAHIIFIKDNSRQWYTQKAGQAAVVAYLQDYFQEQGIRSSLAFGLSMGGYGALVFASLMTFDHVVALASRACVGQWADFDTRNKTLMGVIPESSLSRITSEWINPQSYYVFIASRDQINDLKHLALLKEICPEGNFYLTRGDHNLGHEMNLRGAMKPFLQWLGKGCVSPSPLGVEPCVEEVVRLGRYLIDHKLHGLSTTLLKQDFPELPLQDMPFFLLDAKVQQQLLTAALPRAFPCPCFASVSPMGLRHYLGLGWYAPDSRGAWSQGLWHQLRGQVILPETGVKGLQLRLQLEVFFPPQKDMPLTVEVFQGGKEVKAFSLDRKQKNRHLQLPLSTDGEGVFDLWFHTPFASLPALHKASDDCREIAIYLKSFVITHA